MYYRKKPIVVEAFRFMIDEYMPEWFIEAMNKDKIITYEDGSCTIDTLKEGIMEADKGDYIIKGIKGEVYPCRPNIFHQTYQPYDVDNNLNNKVKIISERFKDKYLLKLAIIDHIKEVDTLYELNRIDKNEIDNYNKELADLYILLTQYFDDKQELIDIRVDRFIEKINGDDKNEQNND